MAIVLALPIAEFFIVKNEKWENFQGFLYLHYVFPASELLAGNVNKKIFIISSEVLTGLCITGTAVLGHFFADKLWEKAIGDLVSAEALKAISISSVVFASIMTGIIMSIAVPNIIAMIVNECSREK